MNAGQERFKQKFNKDIFYNYLEIKKIQNIKLFF